MKKNITLWLLLLLPLATIFATHANTTKALNDAKRYYTEGQEENNPAKREAIKELRAKFRTSDHRGHILNSVSETAEQLLALINSNGQFSDLVAEEAKIDFNAPYTVAQTPAGNLNAKAWLRIWKIARKYRNDDNRIAGLSDAYKKCIMYYGALETSRPNTSHRFLASCFNMASAATATYFCFMSVMDDVESGKITDPSLKDLNQMLLAVGLQAWTQPYRDDQTDSNVVQVSRFRHHVWWVGANGLSYRAVLHAAAMFSSIPMNDVLAEVSQRAISVTSQQTLMDAFWTEGATADGAGWGHGKQNCVWGYPVQGVASAVSFVSQYKGTPWVSELSQDNKDALWTLLRGSSWFYHKGFVPPGLGRTTMVAPRSANKIGSQSIVDNLITYWIDSFTPEEQKELKALSSEMNRRDIYMKDYPAGDYHGTRYYFNNDDLLKRAPKYHVMVNMNSSRCDGAEMDATGNDRYNHFMTDGTTFFQRLGNEYTRAFGAYDVTRMPGVTAREGVEKIVPQTDWSGYKGLYNFAGGATLGGVNAVAGMHYEKSHVGKPGNSVLFLVESYKSYFFFGDYFLALGAGVKNKSPFSAGNIRTGMEQTIKGSYGQHIIENGKELPMTVGTKYSFVDANGKPRWAVQKYQFAYTILPEYVKGDDKAYFMIENKMTNWANMNGSNKNVKNTKIDIFSAWIDHGQRPMDDTYGYAVYLGMDAPGELPFTVIQNSKQVQAVKSKDEQIFQAVIYDPSVAISSGDWHVKASHPAVVLIEKIANGGMNISLTDPTMTYSLSEITLTVNGKQIAVPMPKGDLAGKPAIVEIKGTGIDTNQADLSDHIVIKNKTIEFRDIADAWINIVSIDGKIIKQQHIDNDCFSLDVSFLQSGVYIIHGVLDENRFSQKFLI